MSLLLPSTTPLDDFPDPNCCVALMVGLRPSSRLSEDAEGIRNVDPNIKYVDGSLSDISNKRFCVVLDALAELAVSAEKHEVIAVALRLTDSKVHLIVSGNQELPQNTVDHLNALWTKLQILSRIFHLLQLDQPSGELDNSPFSEDKFTPHLVDGFYKQIYQFSFAKLKKRFEKYWKQLWGFIKAYNEWEDAKKTAIDPADMFKFQKFRRMLMNLQTFSSYLSECHKDDQKWNGVVKYMNNAKVYAMEVLESPTNCEVWANRVKSANSKCFHMRIILYPNQHIRRLPGS